MSSLMSDIVRYLSFLNNECNLNVSVHFWNDLLSSLAQSELEKLSFFNSHNNAYCIKIKGSEEPTDNCIFFQKKIFKRCTVEAVFLIKCYAGVVQYVHTVYRKGVMIGFVAVCGYDNKIFFSEDDVPLELLRSVIPPAALMLEKLFSENIGIVGDEYNCVVQFLNEYHKNISLSYLCEVFERSKSHISHLFKKKSGMTINEYCNNLKLEDAKQLLVNTNLPITEIAYDVGFNDTSYFIKLFKKKFKATPFLYRKNYNQTDVEFL